MSYLFHSDFDFGSIRLSRLVHRLVASIYGLQRQFVHGLFYEVQRPADGYHPGHRVDEERRVAHVVDDTANKAKNLMLVRNFEVKPT